MKSALAQKNLQGCEGKLTHFSKYSFCSVKIIGNTELLSLSDLFEVKLVWMLIYM